MRKHISIFTFLLCVFAVVATSAAEVLMRVEPIGFRVGAVGVFEKCNESSVRIDPSDLSIATSNEPVRLTAVLNKDYKLIGWQKFNDDPRLRTGISAMPFGEGQETVSFVPEAGIDWLYVAVVVEYDPRRIVKADVSSFGKGMVTISPTNEAFKPGDVVTLTATPAEGHSFVRWSDGNGDHVRKLTVGEDNINLKAFIEPDSCRVSFSAGNGAVLGETEKRVSYGSAYGELPVPVREDLAFAGWRDPDGRTITAKTVVDRATDHVLTAVWEIPPESYTVVFDANGGMGVETRVVQTFEVGVAQKLRINAFYYPGHVFVGWNQSSAAEERQFYDEQIVSDLAPAGATLTLFAIWRAEQVAYTVHFDPNAKDATGMMADQEFAVGEEKPLNGCNFRREGYTFLGWSTDKGATSATYADRAKVQGLTSEKNLTLYAVWTKNPVYYIGYKAMPMDKEAWKSETVEQEKNYKLSGTNGLERTGYIFVGWSNDVTKAVSPAGRTCAPQDLKKMVEDEDTISFVAVWEPITYVIHFDGNGGTCTVPNRTMRYDELPQSISVNEIEPPDPVLKTRRTNYELQRWSTDQEGQGGLFELGLDKTKRYQTVVITSNLTATAEDVITLYAQWKGEDQFVTINGEKQKIPYGSELKQPSDPTPWAGHTFASEWTSNGVTVTFPIVVTGSFDLKPIWMTNHYKVAFHGNGADGKMDPQAFTYDEAQMLASNGFTRTGYAFANWTNVMGAAFADGASVKNLATDDSAIVDLYAVWTPNAYTVRFNPGEGSGKMTDQRFVYDVAQALSANGFTAPEWKMFDRWTNAAGRVFASGEVVSNLTAEVNGVVMLTARWKDVPSYTVAFDGNGADGGSMADLRFECGKGGMLASNKFTRTGYVFANWTNETATGMSPPLLGDGAKFEKDLAPTNGMATLSALWTPNRYWVKFDGNDADGGEMMAAQAFTYDVSQALTSNAFTKTGYGFAGWATNATATGMSPPLLGDGAVVSNLTAVADATNTLWATWTVKSYEISFDSAGGSAVAPVTNEFGKTVSAPTPTKKGHQFDGWYEGEVEFDFTSMPARNVQLTAHWTANGYKVRFNSGEGTGEMGDQEFTYDIPQNLTANAFTAPEMKVFDRWTNAVDSATYTNCATVCNLTTGGVFVLYATWKDAPSYAVAFDGNGATSGAMADLRFACGEGGMLASNKFTRTGYAFGQWTNKVNGATFADGATFAEDLAPTNGMATLSALWTPNRYWVAFDANGGAGSMAAQEFTYDVSQALTSNAFTKTGYGFAGWTTNATATGMSPPLLGDAVVVSNLTAVADATNTLWATWAVKSYEISFDPAGGSAVAPMTNEFGKTVSAPIPTKKGHQFDGWYEGEVEFDFTSMPARNVRLTAHWTANGYKVRFNPGEGTGEMDDQSFTYDILQNLTPNTFTPPEMMVFDRWTNAVDSATYTNCATVCNLTTGGVFVLYATWKDAPSYTVAFDGNGADGGSMADLRFECGKGGMLASNKFTRTGYAFGQWTNKVNGATFADGATFAEDLAPTNGMATLSALWTPNRYWVKFDGNDANGGAGSMAAQEFTYDVSQALTSNAFTKTGYGFAGWATNATATGMSPPLLGDAAVVSNLTAVADATNALFATWTANTYTVNFHPNGGSGEAMDPQPFTYDKSQSLKENTFTPPETWMIFAGWSNATDKVVYNAGAVVTNLTEVADGTVDLYAVWGDDSYTVDFDGNGATGTMEPQVFKHGGTGALTSNAYTRIGHTFKNWTNDAGSVYSDGVNFTAPATGAGMTLYAAWTVNEYDCHFVERSEDDQRIDYGGKLESLPQTPSKVGYVFCGWTTNGTDVVDLGTFTMPAHDVVFMPVWEPITYTIAFDGNGATGVAMASTNVKYDVEFALPSNTYERAGYAFEHWTNAVGKVFKDGAPVPVEERPTTDGATMTLYAVWTELGNPLSIALGVPRDWETTSTPTTAWTAIGGPREGLRINANDSEDITLEIPFPEAGTLGFTFTRNDGATENYDPILSLDGDETPYETIDDLTRMPSLGIPKAGTLRFHYAPDNGYWTLKVTSWTPAAK